MVGFIEAECPNCGAALELPSHLDRAFCSHCGGSFIISKHELITDEKPPESPCPLCKGTGYSKCIGSKNLSVDWQLKTYELFAEPCAGLGKCIVYSHPTKDDNISNYCRDGKCGFCGGSGRLLLRTCPFCQGTGDCQFCMGSGKCSFCGGSGKVRCRMCDGRGTKV